jgi:hypothetical protein
MTTMRSPFPKVAPREQSQHCPVCDQPLPIERAGLVRSRLENRERETINVRKLPPCTHGPRVPTSGP